MFNILYYKFRCFLALSMEWRAANIVNNISSLIVFGGFACGVYILAQSSIVYLLEKAHLGLFLLHRFLSMLLFVFFLSVNVGNIIVAYATLYRSRETEYFFSKPISHTALFLVKFLDNFFYSSSVLFMIATAVLFGYGTYFSMPWTFYLQTMLLMFIPFMLISACLAVIMLLVVMRYAARFGIKKVLVGLVVAYLGSMYFYFQMTNPIKLVYAVVPHFPNVDEYFGNLDPPLAKYFPNHWIAESLYWTIKGDPSYAFSYTIILLIATAACIVIMVAVAKRIFYPSWLASLDTRVDSESQPTMFGMYSLTKRPRIDLHTSVLLKKEFWQFIREPSQWIHVGIVSILIVSFLISISKVDLKLGLPFLQTVSYMVILLFTAFLVGSIALRFVFPMISIEGESFWKVMSAPVSRRKVYGVKFMIAYIPLLAISILLTIFSHRPLQEYPIFLYLSIIMMFALSFAIVNLNLGAGAFFANFKEKNPIRIASSQSATLTFLISVLYFTFLIAIVFVPYNQYFEHIIRGKPFDQALFWYGMTMVVLVSLVIGLITMIIGMRAMKRDF